MQSWKEMVENKDQNISMLNKKSDENKITLDNRFLDLKDIDSWVDSRIKEFEKDYFKLGNRIVCGKAKLGDAEKMHEIDGQLSILRELMGEVE